VSTLELQLHAAIARAREENRHRTLEPISSAQGRTVEFGSDSLINFCSNDYLALASDPRVRDAACEAVSRYGVGSGASALLSGRSTVHAELERRVAAFMRCEAALLFSSGYLANLGVITALLGRRDHAFHDRLNHASLIDAVKLSGAKSTRYRHADTQHLNSLISSSDATVRWVITDTVFSMDGDLAPLGELAAIAEQHEATLIGDDAHGFGVLGGGRGTAIALGLGPGKLPVQVVTFGKALGTAGAAVVGSAALIETLIQSSRTFIYDTAPPPVIAAATIAALDVIGSDSNPVTRLNDNINYFRARARDLPIGASTTPIQPVIIGDEMTTVETGARLRECGLYVRAVRPPTVPAGTSRLRICINAGHTRADIDALVAGLGSVLSVTAG